MWNWTFSDEPECCNDKNYQLKTHLISNASSTICYIGHKNDKENYKHQHQVSLLFLKNLSFTPIDYSKNEFDLKTPVPPPTRRIERTIGISAFLDFLFLFFGKFVYETKFNIYITFV